MSEERRDQDVPRGLPDTSEVRRSPVEGGGGSLGGEASERDASALHRGDELILPAPRRRTRQQIRQERRRRKDYTPRERLLILDAWTRTRLPAKDFGGLLGISIHTLYKWRQRFQEDGPAGLEDRKRGPRGGSRLPDETQRAILLMKNEHPDWGQDRIHAMLMRSAGYSASPGAIGRYLEEQGYVVEDVPTRPHPDKPRRFERARPNQMWQTDLFSFVLKRQNRRVHLCVFMDDHSRFIVGFGLHATSSGAMVREVLESAIANYGAPEEILTDNGTQYHTWRGKSAFSKLVEKRGIRQIIASPRHPQTLGKVERFWGTLWRECVEQAIFVDLEDARRRIGLFIDYYNFQRTHSGIEGLVPADRFFASAPQVKETLLARVEANAKELAQQGVPRKSFYLTGRVGEEPISLHAEGERVIYTKGDGTREEVDLKAPGRRDDEPGVKQELPESVSGSPKLQQHPAIDEVHEAPGESPLDDAIVGLTQELRRRTQEAGEEEEGEGPDGEIALEAKRRPGSGDYRTEHEAHGSNDIGGLRDEQDAQDVHDEHDLQDEGEA
jgi:transposase InsO family protein